MSLKKIVLGLVGVAAIASPAFAKDAATCEGHIKALEARLSELKDIEAGKAAVAKAKEHQASADFEGCVEALKAAAEELKI